MKTILQHTLLLIFLFFLCGTSNAFSTSLNDGQCYKISICDGNSEYEERICETPMHTSKLNSQADSLVLVTLYNATDGANWNTPWNLNEPMSTWNGITLNGDGSVGAIILTGNNMSGTIPQELGNLSNLRTLHLNDNFLIGTIPPEFRNLGNLRELLLSDNQLTGSIPPELANLTNMFSLTLNNNELSGCYDSELLSLCGRLFFSNTNARISDGNNLDAPWEDFCATAAGACSPVVCPNQQEQYEALKAFYLSTDGDNWSDNSNWFDAAFFNNNPIVPLGTVFASWFGLVVNGDGCVISMNFEEESIGGTIPSELGNLITLEFLDLDGNGLSGNIPAELGNLSRLRYLNLNSNNLSGNIPPELGNLSSVETILLNFNQLSGSIPPELGNLTNLMGLSIRDNQLIGNIPDELGNLTNLTGLGLDSNQLTGDIPASIGNITTLTGLGLHSNQLSGCYDANLRNLCGQLIAYFNSNAQISDGNDFDADWEDFCNIGIDACIPCVANDYNALAAFANSITDWGTTIPWDLTQPMSTWEGVTLNFNGCVGTINLIGNDISGTIPPELGDLSSITNLNLGNNNFTGTIPRELGNLSTLRQLNLSNNQLTGNIPPELADLTEMFSMELNNNQLTGCYDSALLSLCGRLFFSNTNAQISDGNNFDAAWEDFCAAAEGACTTPVCPNQQEQYEALKAFYLSTEGDSWSDKDNWFDAAFFNANPTVPPGTVFASWAGLVVNGDGCVVVMNFDDENISGTIPPELGKLTTLEYLDLGSNNLSGSIPPELGNLTNLTFLNLNNNNLTGSVPPELGNLSSLELMYLNYNNLSGSIPPELGNLTNLTTLSIRSNQLSGEIPDELGNLANLIYLALDGNQLTGSIPASIGNITTLVNLSLHSNQLSGCYDISLQNLCNQLNTFFNSNAQISDGNNFDAPWEDFCSMQAGTGITVDLRVHLEGAYQTASGEMTTALNTTRGLLPGQTPASPLVTPTPAGHPYSIAPWNHTGTEGANLTGNTYSSDAVDWVLVSLRTEIGKSTQVAMTAGILNKNGRIYFPNRCPLSVNQSPVYIVVEHRNHMGIMTAQPVVIGGTLTYDFTQTDTYDGNGTGAGQVEISPGIWAMYAGDGEQISDIGSYDIKGPDKTIWFETNGVFDNYMPADYNLDGDVNGNDKALWFNNNGTSSRVPK